MAKIPTSVLEQPIQGLELRGRGKVRDSYNLPGHPDKMLVVTSNRCSIFDFVLPTLVSLKGEILTALNHFWTTEVLGAICETDFIACGSKIDEYLPEALHNDTELQKRATVVQIVPAPDVEDIVRFILAGSGLTSYNKNRTICGHRLPEGLVNGSLLPYPIYAPTTKAIEGHDEHITADSVIKRYGYQRERVALQAACAIANYAAQRGIIMADTKFEFSLVGDRIILADEKGTPDSSRFVDKKAWETSKKGQLPTSLDKQFVREWGKKLGIDKLDPKNPDDVAYVHSLEVPANVVEMTTRLYRYIFWRITGMQIEDYQTAKMGINIHTLKRSIEVLVGSESDLPQIQTGITSLIGIADVNVSIVSCHRNPEELRKFVISDLAMADVIIAGAGMAAALPGIVKSELCALGYSEIPVIGVAFKGNSDKNNTAAKLSIECLPGEPVELDPDGKAYFGSEGFLVACQAAVRDEFLPKGLDPKPARFGINKPS